MMLLSERVELFEKLYNEWFQFFLRNIILGDGNTLKILRKHKAYKNIEYVFDEFYIV